jgi:glycolate oxidase iron-sulfur subunit
VPKNSSGYNVLDILRQLKAGVPVDWTRLFAHSEGTLGIITEAKLRAVPLATQKATCIVYFTDLQEACGSIPKIYSLAPSCFDTAVTTNLDLIRKTYPALGIREDAKVMYIVEFDDLEVKPDPRDPARRIGQVRIMEKQAAAELIQKQVDALQKLLETDYPKTAIGFDVARDPARQDALWQGRRGALQVLYGYGQGKRPLTMIECVVIPRDEEKLLAFISYMEEVFNEEQVVAGTHGHAGDCNFHLYLLLNLTEQQDRQRLIKVMTKITQKVTELGGSMSGEHADGRTRGIILPHVFGLGLFDLFVEIKDLMDPRATLHPGSKIIKEARDQDLHQAIEELVGIEDKDSRLNLARFRDFSHLYMGVCSLCSQCADICPIFSRLPDEFTARTEAAPTFKRALAVAREINGNVAALKDDPLFEKVFDLCLLCGQCTWKCPTSASMRDMVAQVREEKHSKVLAPAIESVMSHRTLYNLVIGTAGVTQGLWNNRLGRKVIAGLPQGLIPSHIPAERYIPPLAKSSVEARYRELYNVPAPQADIAYFYGCSSDLFAVPIVDSFIAIARHHDWKVSLPPHRCCGEPFAAAGNTEEYHRLARYNIDQLVDFKYVVAHCPSCIIAFKEYAQDFARIGDTAYEQKAREIVNKLYDPAQFIIKIIGSNNLKPAKNGTKQKVAVHVSCHEKLGHKITASTNYTRDLLNLIPGLEIVAMKGADECCGQGGPWGLAGHYDLSVKMRRDKIANVMDSQADVVTSWCLGCMIQMRDGLGQAKSAIKVRHPLELLSEAYA